MIESNFDFRSLLKLFHQTFHNLCMTIVFERTLNIRDFKRTAVNL